MKTIRVLSLALQVWLAVACAAEVHTGLDNVADYGSLFAGRRIGIIANHTAYDQRGRFIVDVFQDIDEVQVVALFSPEHGLYGVEEAGEPIDDRRDPKYGLPLHSLYGRTRKPTPQMLEGIDVLVFDIQDVGVRFYTYISTMSLAMEAAAECGKRFIVLDRPNPIGGTKVEGPILEPSLASFVGLHAIPVRHGLTVGELARMIDGQGWLAGGVHVDLSVVPMTGWNRAVWYDQTGQVFRKPSPNMPDLDTATVYPGLCLLEGTNVSEGRGTTMPFRQFGAPWIDGPKLAARLNGLNLPGLTFHATTFTPAASKHEGRLCSGVRIEVTDRDRLEPFWSGVCIVNEIARMAPDEFEWRADHFDRLCGTAAIREAIANREPLPPLRQKYLAACESFRRTSRPYLLYPD
ncbi:MAG TPA: DUF1343 domain-containing protein [Sedimentisphaerales bacterium]|nr:DUF1343 domain-containing protein [Sedimentisphaerales bacterium]HRS11962.1 DUF1343 domain-containing protein [Sedimentisphaerales bacterium]HRV49018.1 DUF1343 domain-containing protein [Sedimentisphaerales bacterium]